MNITTKNDGDEVMNGECPLCNATVHLKSTVKIGHIVECNKCNSELEIINLNPIELDWPLQEFNEDDDYDFDDDDDDY